MADSTKVIAPIAFAIALGLYIVISALPQNSDEAILVDFLSTVGLFLLIFYGILWLYDNYLFKLDKRLDIGGTWYQVMIISGSEPLSERIRLGECNIDCHPGRIALIGESKKIDSVFSSNWQSETTVLNQRELAVVYHSEGEQRVTNKYRGGYIRLTLAGPMGSRPEKLLGTWYDVYPSQNSGSMELFRDKLDYDSRVNQLTDVIKNSTGTSAPESSAAK